MNEADVSKRHRRRWWFISLIILAIGSVLWFGPQIVFQLQYGGMPIAAQTGGFAPDCIWSGKVVTWIDNNANGMRDEGEPPLSDVQVKVDDVLNHYNNVGRSEPSNWRGETSVSVWLPGCPIAKFEVYPEVPVGYQLTSAPRLTADVRETNQTFEFGFAYLPGVPTVTPMPPPPRCNSYRIGLNNQYNLTDLTVARDGTVWAATFNNGVAHYLPTQDSWVTYKTSDGLVNDQVNSITAADDGTVWFGTAGGAAHFDGSAWSSYTTADGLIHNNVLKVIVAKDGSIWFATQGGVSHFRPDQQMWKDYTTKDGLADDFANYAAITPDNSIWFATVTRGISRLIDPDNTAQWVTYSQYTKSDTKVPLDMVNVIKVAPNGSYWFGGLGGLMYFDPSAKTWASTHDEFADSVHDFDFARDGSIWIATGITEPIIYHFIPARDKNGRSIWRSYDKRDGLPTIAGETRSDPAESISVAQDGSVWIGTYEFAVHCVFPEH